MKRRLMMEKPEHAQQRTKTIDGLSHLCLSEINQIQMQSFPKILCAQTIREQYIKRKAIFDAAQYKTATVDIRTYYILSQ